MDLDGPSVADLPIRELTYAGQMTIRPEPTGLSAARHRIRTVANDLRLNDEAAADLLTAVGEALSNAYLYGTIDRSANLIYLGWHFAGDVLTVTVKDEGPGFAPYEMTPSRSTDRPLRGWGLKLMREGVDDVHFDFEDGAKVVMKKRVASRRSHLA